LAAEVLAPKVTEVQVPAVVLLLVSHINCATPLVTLTIEAPELLATVKAFEPIFLTRTDWPVDT
jgi:hypothetical protein